MTHIFETVLGHAWDKLPPTVRRFHAGPAADVFMGTAEVRRGAGWIENSIAKVMGFPAAGTGVPVTVTIERRDGYELWERNFAGRIYRSRQTPSSRPGFILESMGFLTFELQLPFDGATVGYTIRRGWAAGIPMPAKVLPSSDTREYEANGRYRFDISLFAPLTRRLIVSYRGWLEPADGERPA